MRETNAIKRYLVRFMLVAISETIIKKKSVGRWQLFDSSPSPLSLSRRGRNISSSERRVPRKKKGSIGSIGGPRAEVCPLRAQCFSRHTDKGTQIPREKIRFSVDACFRDARVSQCEALHTHTRTRFKREFVRACVRARRLAATP